MAISNDWVASWNFLLQLLPNELGELIKNVQVFSIFTREFRFPLVNSCLTKNYRSVGCAFGLREL